MNKLLPKSRKQRQQLQRILIAVVGIVATIGIGLLFRYILRASDQSSTVLFINSSSCPEVTLTLLGDGRRLTSSLKPGEREEIDVVPDFTYDFQVDTSSDPDEAGYSCLDIEPGQLSVPRGSTFTINVESRQRPYFLLINDTECPTATLTLWEAVDLRANIDPVLVRSGEEANIEISPDRPYEYRIRMESDIEDDERCYEVESGTIELGLDKNTEIRISSLARVDADTENGE